MRAPLIGVTPSASVNILGIRTYTLAIDYTQAIERAGGIPVILPLHIADIDMLLECIDGIVFSGGGDIDPAIFDQERHETTESIDAERDAFEIALIEKAFARDVPILAICRGIQVMNVAQGGTLIQDIPTQTDADAEHAQRRVGVGEHDLFQSATILEGDNLVSAAMGAGLVNINSFHHQALGDVASSLEVVATSDDGIIEAVYAPEQTFVIGTQWHPERLAAEHTEHQALFDRLVQAARQHALTRV